MLHFQTHSALLDMYFLNIAYASKMVYSLKQHIFTVLEFHQLNHCFVVKDSMSEALQQAVQYSYCSKDFCLLKTSMTTVLKMLLIKHSSSKVNAAVLRQIM